MHTLSGFPPIAAAPKRGLKRLERILELLVIHFRTRRHQWFAAEFQNCSRVIDIGGRPRMWGTVSISPHVTIINVEADQAMPAGFSYRQGDGRDLPYPDGSFDLAFSNSVIEHVGTREDQQRFAGQMLRIGKRIYCQTPNKWFPVEPHFGTVVLHWLPRRWFTYFVHRCLTLHGILERPSRAQSREMVQSIRLLTRKEFAGLFPGCKIRTERFLGWPKSYIAWR